MGFSGNSSGDASADINVTPLVDVMLVLLVIFMVTAPMMQQGVDVNLPKVTTGAMSGKTEQIVLSIDKDGAVFLGSKNEVSLEDLPTKVRSIFEQKKDAEDKIYIKADQDIHYGRVMEVMSSLYKGGITQVGLVTDPEE